MSEKVFPSSKPAPPPAAPIGTAAPNPPLKPRPQYRPQPYNHTRTSRRRRSKKNICCCCFFWTFLLALVILLLAVIAGASLYMLYRPHRPSFKLPFIRVQRLNSTFAQDGSTHLVALFNLTVASRNPNSHISFSYDKFSVTAVSESGVFLGNGSLPSFVSARKNENTFRNVVVSGSTDLDGDSDLKKDTKRKSDGNRVLAVKLVLDTKVVARVGKLRSKRVGIRVTCNGIRAVAPTKKSGPTVVITTGVTCKVDLRIKIWKFTL